MNKYAKAIVGALVAGLAALQTALLDDKVTTNEWIAVATAVVTALGLIWGVQNKDTAAAQVESADVGVPILDTPA